MNKNSDHLPRLKEGSYAAFIRIWINLLFKELKEITGKDYSFDLLSWMNYLHNLSGRELKVVPLRKKIDN